MFHVTVDCTPFELDGIGKNEGPAGCFRGMGHLPAVRTTMAACDKLALTLQAFAGLCVSAPSFARSSTVMALAMKLAGSLMFDGMISVLLALASSLNAPT